MFLTLLQNHSSPPPTPPINTADIGPGDYSTIKREYPLKGAIKRKRLKKAEIRKIKEIVAENVDFEKLATIAKKLLPQVSASELPDIVQSLQTQLDSSLKALLSGLQTEQDSIKFNEQLKRQQERIFIEAIAKYQQTLEDDEILLAYLI